MYNFLSLFHICRKMLYFRTPLFLCVPSCNFIIVNWKIFFFILFLFYFTFFNFIFILFYFWRKISSGQDYFGATLPAVSGHKMAHKLWWQLQSCCGCHKSPQASIRTALKYGFLNKRLGVTHYHNINFIILLLILFVQSNKIWKQFRYIKWQYSK